MVKIERVLQLDPIFMADKIMETSILHKLKEHLATIMPEQFQKEWDEIETMGLQRPSIKEFFNQHSKNGLTDERPINAVSE